MDADVAAWRRHERQRLLASRRARSSAEVAAASQRVAEKLLALCVATPPRCLAVYWPLDGELDLRSVFPRLEAQGIALALPRVVARAQPLEFRAYATGAPLVVSAFGLHEPPADETLAPRVTVDALAIPMLGFDADRYRLGHGGGYYDRTLPLFTARRIGIAYADAALPTIHPQAHDQQMDLILTD